METEKVEAAQSQSRRIKMDDIEEQRLKTPTKEKVEEGNALDEAGTCEKP